MKRSLAMQSDILKAGSTEGTTPILPPAAPFTAERVLGIVLWVALVLVVVGVGSLS